MKEYRTTAIVELFTGKVVLSEKQAARRPGKFKKVGKGIYEVLSPVQFKAGEVIRLNNPDKITLSKVDEVEVKKGVKK